MSDEAWPTEWLRAVLGLWILSVVSARETYGYAIARALRSAGLGDLKGGTLYPALARLEEEGLLESRWIVGDGGPGRKLLSITASGSAALARRTAQWQRLVASTDALLSLTTEEEGHDRESQGKT